MSAVIERFPDDAVDLTRTVDPDRTPLILKADDNGKHWIGIAGPDGEMLPMKGVRSPKAYRPLAMDDRFVCWHTTADYYEVVRLGAMNGDDLLGAVHNAEWRCNPSLLTQSLLWLWWRVSGVLMDDRTSTLESLTDSEGNSPLDTEWKTAL